MKKVAVDFRIMDTLSGERGVGYYSFHQFQALENLGHPDLEFIYYTFFRGRHYKQLRLSQTSKFWQVLSLYNLPYGIRRLDPLFKRFWQEALKKSQPDLLHITHLFETLYLDVPTHIPSVITFYDLIPYFNLEKYFTNEKARNWYKARLDQLNKADKIIAISQSVKNDLIKYLSFDEDKIKVIYGGFDFRFKVLDKQMAKSLLIQKYNLKNNFILSQPAFSVHKNVERIFLSFQQLIKETANNLDLVLVCKLLPEEEKIWNDKLQELGIKQRVILTNFVPDEDMPMFYTSAEVLLFPSLYEGFGLPILEAMACGCPVVTSNTSSMPEAGGEAAVYINPESVDDITQNLEKVLSDKKLRQEIIQKGFQQIKKFSWENCAKQTLEVYEEVLAK